MFQADCSPHSPRWAVSSYTLNIIQALTCRCNPAAVFLTAIGCCRDFNFVRSNMMLFGNRHPNFEACLSDKKGKSAVQARKKLTNVYGEGVLTVRQCQNWFAKFRSGKFDVEDAPRSGRPVEADKGIS
ncbi:histone-lysine N-methyltransferase SETMAR [Trichonephila clavipes]|nr:histone-lysine N-methyltransferase SETMAR [Trichonephila clavipes]